MAKIRYSAKENNRVGTHSFYGQAIPTGKLSFRELCEEACEDNTYSVEEMQGCVSKFMKAVQREALRGWRCQLGEDFLTIFPQIDTSIKDYTDKEGKLVVVTADMLTAVGAKSRLGCSVHKKFSAKFASEVSWQKVDASGNDIEEEEDITQGNDGPTGDDDGNGGNQNQNQGGNGGSNYSGFDEG